jgi:hypothetical protein
MNLMNNQMQWKVQLDSTFDNCNYVGYPEGTAMLDILKEPQCCLGFMTKNYHDKTRDIKRPHFSTSPTKFCVDLGFDEK